MRYMLIATGLVALLTAVSGAGAPRTDAPSRPSLPGAGAQPIAYFPAADVKDAFRKGRPLVEVEGYKIHASRREAPGEAEIHTLDTDVIYVLEGRATIVTGGSVRTSRTTAPGELRGTTIDGGTARTLVPGDVLVVPNGTPHQFTAVDAPFLYYVVKVTDIEGGSR